VKYSTTNLKSRKAVREVEGHWFDFLLLFTRKYPTMKFNQRKRITKG
jgi:hypothetical protein